MTLDRNGLEVLDPAECLALLGRSTLGRVAITVGALPTILPINFRLIGGDVVFRTGVGTKLDAAARGAVIAFEVDDVDPVDHTGWSVVVTGIARETPSDDRTGPIDATTIPRWAPSGESRLLFLPTAVVTGRRITHRAPSGGGAWAPPSGAGEP